MTPFDPPTAAPAYFVALVEIHDPARFQCYHEQFEATLVRLKDGWSRSGPRSSLWKVWTGRLRERQLSFFRPSRRDGTGSNRPLIKELHRSANDLHVPRASSSKGSPYRKNEADRSDSRLTGQGGSDESR